MEEGNNVFSLFFLSFSDLVCLRVVTMRRINAMRKKKRRKRSMYECGVITLTEDEREAYGKYTFIKVVRHSTFMDAEEDDSAGDRPESLSRSLHVITLSTDDRGPIENWEFTAKLHGYDYTILGRGEKWQGWPWRTKKYLERVLELPEGTLVLLCDGNDIIFARGPAELIRAYDLYETDLLFGGEPTCCTGKYGIMGGISGLSNRDYAIKTIVEREPATRWCFPNAGCIMGTRERIIQILEENKDEPDDQAGYLGKYLSNPSYLKVDFFSRVVGNVNAINYFFCVECDMFDDSHKYELQFWEPVRNLSISNHLVYRNKLTGEIPCILHFPGKNILLYNVMGHRMFKAEFKMVKPKPKKHTQPQKALFSIADHWK